MIRVLQILSGLHRNGTETFIMNLFRNIDRSRIMFDFLVYEHAEDGYEQEVRELGSHIYYYSPRRDGYTKYIKSLKDFFEANATKYGAVHYSGNSFSDIFPIRLAKRYLIPIRIMHSHNSLTAGIHNKILHSLNKRRLFSIATDFLACSDVAQKWGFYGTKCMKKSLVIPNGIDIGNFQFNESWRDEIRKELGLKPDTFVVCHTGAFRKVKNHSFLIEIFSKIKRQNPDSMLLLCGEGEEKETILTQIKQFKLEKYVKILGIRTDINKILSASDAYVFPSMYEGLPFALIEAQASGIPIFASDTISPEIKMKDNLQFLSLKKTAEEWAKAILENDYRKRDLRITDRLRQYDIKETCKILTDIYSRQPSES